MIITKYFTFFLLLLFFNVSYFHCLQAQTVQIKLESTSFHVAYDGYGLIRFMPGGDLIFASGISDEKHETHATLLLLKETLLNPPKNFRLEIEASTEQQLRVPAPNPWESFWIFFNYIDANNQQGLGLKINQGHKETNYVIHKTNGAELGKAYNDITQEFLVTTTNSPLILGKRNRYELTRLDSKIIFKVNDDIVIDYTIPSPPTPPGTKLPYEAPGAIGLYTEDAKIRIHACVLTRLK